MKLKALVTRCLHLVIERGRSQRYQRCNAFEESPHRFCCFFFAHAQVSHLKYVMYKPKSRNRSMDHERPIRERIFSKQHARKRRMLQHHLDIFIPFFLKKEEEEFLRGDLVGVASVLQIQRS